MNGKYLFVLIFLLLCCSPCNGNNVAYSSPPSIYVVDDTRLMEEVGNYQNPDTNPTYEGGIEELKKYFAENSLKGEIENHVFRAYVYFLVDKKGVAKDFHTYKWEPRNSEQQKLLNWNIDVRKVVSKMPQKWIPAQVDGKPVKCYQVLSFTVVCGQLDKTVSYR